MKMERVGIIILVLFFCTHIIVLTSTVPHPELELSTYMDNNILRNYINIST